MLVRLLLFLVSLGNEFSFPTAFSNHANHLKKLDNTFDNNNDFVFLNDEPRSYDDIPKKAGRTIHRSAWSTEDNDEKQKKIRNAPKLPFENDDPGKDIRSWDFSNLLELVLNLLNKLKENNIIVSTQNFELEGSNSKAKKSRSNSKYKSTPEIKRTENKPQKKNNEKFQKTSINFPSQVFKDGINENPDSKAKDSRSNHRLSHGYEDSKFDDFKKKTKYKFKNQPKTGNKKGSIFETDKTSNLKSNRDVQNIKRNQPKSSGGKLKNLSVILLLKKNSDESYPLDDVIEDNEEFDPFILSPNLEQSVVGENSDGTGESNEELKGISWDNDDSCTSDSSEVTDESQPVSGGTIKKIPVPSKVVKTTKPSVFKMNKFQALNKQNKVDDELDNSNKNIKLKQRDKTPKPFPKTAQTVQASNSQGNVKEDVNQNSPKTTTPAVVADNSDKKVKVKQADKTRTALPKTTQEVQVFNNQDEANEELNQKSHETSTIPAIATDNFDKKVTSKQTDKTTTPFPKTAQTVQALNNQDELNEEMNRKSPESATIPAVVTGSSDNNMKAKQTDKNMETSITPANVTDNSDKKAKSKQAKKTTTPFPKQAQVLNNQDEVNEFNQKFPETSTTPATVTDNFDKKVKSKQTDNTTTSFPDSTQTVQVQNNQDEVNEEINQKSPESFTTSAIVTDNSNAKVKANQTSTVGTPFPQTAKEFQVFNNQDGLNEELNQNSFEIFTTPAIGTDNSNTNIKTKQTDKTVISFPETAQDVQVLNTQNGINKRFNQKYHRRPTIDTVADQPSVHQNHVQKLNLQFSTLPLENSAIEPLLDNSETDNQAVLRKTTLKIPTPVSSNIQNDSNKMVLDKSTKNSKIVFPYIDQHSTLPYKNQEKFKKKFSQGYRTSEDEKLETNTDDKIKALGPDKQPLEGKKLNNGNDAPQKQGLFDADSYSNLKPDRRPITENKLNNFGNMPKKLNFFGADSKSKVEPDKRPLVIKDINNIDYIPQKTIYFETDSNSKVEEKVKSPLIAKELILTDDAMQKQVPLNSDTNGENSLNPKSGTESNNLSHDIPLSEVFRGIEEKDFQTVSNREMLPISSSVAENEPTNKISNEQQEKSKATTHPQKRKPAVEQHTLISSDVTRAPGENQYSVIYKSINPISEDSVSDNNQIKNSAMQKDNDQISNAIEEEETGDSYEYEEDFYSSEEDSDSEINEKENEEYVTVNSSPSLASNSDKSINPSISKQPVEKEELKKPYDTILQFLYKNSNNPFIQALRENSTLS